MTKAEIKNQYISKIIGFLAINISEEYDSDRLRILSDLVEEIVNLIDHG